MAEEIRLWRIEANDSLHEIAQGQLNLESRIEEWLARDISILDRDLLVIGRQVETGFGGFIDLLCINRDGEIVVVELKRDKTPREITAQVLDYGSWVGNLSNEAITSRANAHLAPDTLEQAFQRRFASELPDTLNEEHRLLIVGSQIDPSSERIINYLSNTYGVGINAATFQFFKDQAGSDFLARFFLIEPSQVELQARSKGTSKRQPNLSLAELDAIAVEVGVEDLYRSAVAKLDHIFQKQTTRSSVGFKATFGNSRKTVISFIPRDSNSSDGLYFQVYSLRLQTYLNVSESAVAQMLPSGSTAWRYSGSTEPDWMGFEGFIANEVELTRLVDGLRQHLDN